MSKTISCQPQDYESTKSDGLFGAPINVGEYSLDKQGFHLGDSQQKHLYEMNITPDRRLPLDVFAGFDSFDFQRAEAYPKNILSYLMAKHPAGSSLKAILADYDIVCSQGLFKNIASIPYPYSSESQNCIACCIYADVVFMAEFDSHYYHNYDTMNESLKKNVYASFKFKQLMRVNDPNSRPNDNNPVCTCNKFFRMQARTMGPPGAELKLLYSAEMDCIDKNDNDVELNCTRSLPTDKDPKYHDSKMMKWWLQTSFGGVERIVYGTQNYGKIVKVQEIKSSDIMKEAKAWKPVVCMAFLYNALATAKEMLNNRTEHEVLLIERDVGASQVRFTILTDPNACAQYPILTSEFKTHFKSSA